MTGRSKKNNRKISKQFKLLRPRLLDQVQTKHVQSMVSNSKNTYVFAPFAGMNRLSTNVYFISLLGLFSSSSVTWAACSTAGSTVTCTGVPSLPLFLNNYANTANNLTVNVAPAAEMNSTLGGIALQLTGNGSTVNNSGTIDPSIRGALSQLSGGLFVGNLTSASTVNITNNVSGFIYGTAGSLGPTLTSLAGLALHVQNLGGSVNVTNNGEMNIRPLDGFSLIGADALLGAIYGGAQINFVNSSTGTMIGRVAFESSTAGNSFTNAGEIFGSVSLGAGGSNTFISVTGSTVSNGGGIGVPIGGLPGVNITFAATGTVDGGAGGTNLLILQNATGAGGGTTGTGTAPSSVYTNFTDLLINSGTWTLQGPLVSGTSTLNGGVAQFNNNATFGTGLLTSNGGAIQASNAGLTVANPVTLGVAGLVVQGINSFTLSGAISGLGGLTKVGGGMLTLSGANNYTGGTSINGGTLAITNNNALGEGNILVNGASTLTAAAPTVQLANISSLNGSLTINGVNALTLAGSISGASGLTKTGAGTLTLLGANTGYTGVTTLNAGTLIVGNNNALGSGALNVNGASTLATNAAATLSNNITLNNSNLTLLGSSALNLAGTITGTGGIIKDGAALLNLFGANTYTGATVLNTGGLVVGNNNALGSDVLNAANNTNLDASSAVTLSNNMNLDGNLNIQGTSALNLAGIINGAGGTTKNGTAKLVLDGVNNYLGDTLINNGSLIIGSDSAHSLARILGNAQVNAGGTLGGHGSVGGNAVVATNGHLAPGNSIGKLTIGGDLTLAQGSILDFEFDTVGVSDNVQVNGNLNLNGSILNIIDSGGFSPGVYTLFTYGGMLTQTNDGIVFGSTPGGSYSIQYLETDKKINLINNSGPILQFWNANGLASSQQRGGGTGVWSTTSPVWANMNGSVTSAMIPQPGFAIFGGAPGVVTIDNSSGQTSATGMQFE